MARKIDMLGRRFGSLIVASRIPGNPRAPRWVCICDCGAESVVLGMNLRSGHTASCGCKKRPHGHSANGGTPTYMTWCSMWDRCTRKGHKAYHRYGGRGISVDPRWSSFKLFLMDMGERPSGTSLDRIDNDKGYTKLNCRWATSAQQAANKSIAKFGPSAEEAKTLSQWSRLLGGSKNMVRMRIFQGWDVAAAIGTPNSRRSK